MQARVGLGALGFGLLAAIACATASGPSTDVAESAPSPVPTASQAGDQLPASSSGGGSSSGASTSDAAAPADPPVVVDGGPPCTCPDMQGCLQVAVHRGADESKMPWKRGIPGADGVGALTVTFSQAGVVAARGGAPNVDLRGGVTYRAVMCAPAGIWDVHVFLDDNDNADAMVAGSVEAADICSAPPSVSVLVDPARPQTMSATLVGSCH